MNKVYFPYFLNFYFLEYRTHINVLQFFNDNILKDTHIIQPVKYCFACDINSS